MKKDTSQCSMLGFINEEEPLFYLLLHSVVKYINIFLFLPYRYEEGREGLEQASQESSEVSRKMRKVEPLAHSNTGTEKIVKNECLVREVSRWLSLHCVTRTQRGTLRTILDPQNFSFHIVKFLFGLLPDSVNIVLQWFYFPLAYSARRLIFLRAS